ncbi:MAG TPA: CHAT domain-containing protein [Pyrinomonadaceae bacterium]|jgi:CHAT domain-containing protein
MQMISLKTIYQSTLSVTLLFATSNLFTVFAINAKRPFDGEKIRQTNNETERRGQQEDAELKLGKPIERNLAGNEAHSYKIVLAANQYLHVVVDQRGIDVVVALFAPDGKKMTEVDSPNGTHGLEPISVVAEAAGNYRLEVRSLEAAAEAGRYQVKVEELRTGTQQDKNRIAAQNAAQQAYTEGDQLRGEGSAGSLRKAIDKYQEALPLWRTVNDSAKEASTLNSIGFVYSSLGEKQKALDFYNRALPLRRAVGDSNGEAYTLNNIGAVFDILGEKQKALDFYNQALLLSRAVGDRSGEAETLNSIGVLYSSLGEKQKALDFYNQALLLRRAVGDRSGEAITLTSIASVVRDQGNFEESLVQIETALIIIESLRTKIASHELRSSYFATVQNIYELYIDILMRLHKQQPAKGYDAKAIQASERARARSLLETLTEANADIRQGIDPTLLERERSTQQLIAGKSERLTRISNDERLKAQKPAAEKEVNELLAQYQDIQAQIRVKSPRYAALTQPVPTTFEEIQRLLDKDTTLLEYSLGEERSYLWLVTPQSLKSYELPKRAQIEETANRLLETITIQNNVPMDKSAEYLKRQAVIKQTKANYPKTAAELSKMLLGQIAGEIEGKRLLIVGDGVLQYAPFAALPNPYNTNKSTNVGEPLIASNEIVTLPSASTLAILRREETARRNRKSYTKTVAVFADPVFDADDQRVSGVALKSSPTASRTVAKRGQIQKSDSVVPSADLQSTVFRSAAEVGLTDRGRLKRLVESKNEAAAIQNAASTGQSTIALGFDASRERVMSSNLADYRIVHFATHGLLNEENPELSGVVLSLVDQHGKQQNGFLRLHEIYNLNLPVEMIVLSACQTGLGKKIKGEGLVGLTRGFMYAGTPRVVASLWSVDDAATAELMSIFYRKMLREAFSPPAALRAAQNEIRRQERWRSPAYWAGFTLQGEWQKIELVER